MELSHADRPVEAVIRLVRVDGRDRSVWSCAAAAHIKEVSPLGGVDARLHAAALARTSRYSDASSPARDARTAAHCAPRPRRRCHPLQRLTQPVTHPLSRRSLVESYGCSVRSEIMMVAAETAVSPAAAAWFAAEKAAQSGMPGTSVVSVCRLCVAFSECGSVL